MFGNQIVKNVNLIKKDKKTYFTEITEDIEGNPIKKLII